MWSRKKKEKETEEKEEIKKLKRKGGQRVRLWRICLFYLSRQAENITKTKFGKDKLEACNLEVRLGQISHVANLLFSLKKRRLKTEDIAVFFRESQTSELISAG